MDMQMPEMTQPMVAATAPEIPAICRPTKVDVLTARGPGVICEMVIISVNTFGLTQPYLSTTCSCIAGIIA